MNENAQQWCNHCGKELKGGYAILNHGCPTKTQSGLSKDPKQESPREYKPGTSREFYLILGDHDRSDEIFRSKPLTHFPPDYIHVIEFSAYQALQEESAALKAELYRKFKELRLDSIAKNQWFNRAIEAQVGFAERGRELKKLTEERDRLATALDLANETSLSRYADRTVLLNALKDILDPKILHSVIEIQKRAREALAAVEKKP